MTIQLKAYRKQPRRCTAQFSIHPRSARDDEHEDREVSSSLPWRALAVVLFRKWFGREPSISSNDPEYAWAEDHQGNYVFLVKHHNFQREPIQRGLLLPEKCEAA